MASRSPSSGRTIELGTISRRSTDVALLQEVVPPAWARDRWTIEARPIRDWGTAIVAKPGLKLQRTPDADAYSATGTVGLADGTELIVASVHTQVGRASPQDYGGFDPQAVRRPRRAFPHHNDIAYAGTP